MDGWLAGAAPGGDRQGRTQQVGGRTADRQQSPVGYPTAVPVIGITASNGIGQVAVHSVQAYAPLRRDGFRLETLQVAAARSTSFFAWSRYCCMNPKVCGACTHACGHRFCPQLVEWHGGLKEQDLTQGMA
jgi:hypothetical protein